MLAVGRLKSLKVLTIIQPVQELTDEGLKGLTGLTQLERLSLRSLVGGITDASLRVIAEISPCKVSPSKPGQLRREMATLP